NIHPQPVLVEPMAGCDPIPLEIIPGHPCKLGDVLRRARAQRAGDGRLVGTARPAKGALHRGVCPKVTLLWAMVLAPQRMPTRASSTLSIGRCRMVFWGTLT